MTRTRRRLLELAKLADELKGDKDEKLQKLAGLVKTLVKDGFNPIVFCPTDHPITDMTPTS